MKTNIFECLRYLLRGDRPSQTANKRIALLIDADNTSTKYIDTIISELSAIGSVDIKRAYGDFTSPTLKNWDRDVLNKFSIKPIQHFAYTTGKNSTDGAMIIDAMDILFTKDIDCFCIATSDSDFIRLTQRIREEGKTVIGMGRQQTIPAFVNACNEFKFLDVLSNETEADDENSNLSNFETSITPLQSIKNFISQYIAAGDENVYLGGLKQAIVSKYSDFDERNYGYSKFSTFINSLGDFQVNGNLCFIKIEYRKIPNYIQQFCKNNSNKSFTSTELHNQIVKKYKSFKLVNLGFTNMKSFLSSLPNIEIVDGNKYRYKKS